MKVIRDELWFCVDCTMLAVNGDASGMSDEQEEKSTKGLNALGEHIVPDFDTETGEGHKDFARPSRGCDCCGSGFAGEFHRFSQLGPDDVFVLRKGDMVRYIDDVATKGRVLRETEGGLIEVKLASGGVALIRHSLAIKGLSRWHGDPKHGLWVHVEECKVAS